MAHINHCSSWVNTVRASISLHSSSRAQQNTHLLEPDLDEASDSTFSGNILVTWPCSVLSCKCIFFCLTLCGLKTIFLSSIYAYCVTSHVTCLLRPLYSFLDVSVYHGNNLAQLQAYCDKLFDYCYDIVERIQQSMWQINL